MFSHRPTRALVSVAVTGLAGASTLLAQYPSQNITLRGHVTLSQFGSGSGAGCRGYVSPSGREYAVMGLNNKVAIVEITNPAAPVIVGSVSHQTGLWSEVELYGHYVYASNETGGGIDIINLANVDSGQVTLVQRMTTGGVSTTHTVTIDPVSGFLYLNGSNVGGGRLLVYSLANPESPELIGQVNTSNGSYVHDSLVVTYPNSGPYANQQIAFVFSGGDGLDILNVTNKASMVRLSRTEYSNLVYCHQGALSADRQFLYVDDEIDGLPYTRVFNVTNLSAPVELPQFYIGAASIDHNQWIKDGFLFQANYTSGLHIHDLANPTSPVHVGFFDTYPDGDPQQYEGAWNTWPYFPSGNVIISDINDGLFIVDPSRALNYLNFTFPNGRPATISPAGGTTIRVEVSGRLAEPEAGTGMLHYSTGAGYVAIPMTVVSPNVYDAVFPALPCGSIVSYYVSAENELGDEYDSPGGAPSDSYSAAAVSGTNVVLTDAFEAASGWTGGVAGDTATTGVWVRVNPNGTGAQPEDDHSSPGTFCWVTGQGSAGGQIGDADVDGGRTTLLSPSFNLAAYDAALISYWRWYSNGQGGAPNEDVFRIDISNNNGSSWVNVETIGPAGPDTIGGWVFHEFPVGNFVPLTSQVRLRFVAEDAGSGSVVEAGLDDFQIREVVCEEPPCPADLTGDGIVDLGDLSLLLANFGCVSSCNVDLDADGDTDLSDLTLLLSAFGTTCP